MSHSSSIVTSFSNRTNGDVSLSSYVYDTFSVFTDGQSSVQTKIETASFLEPFVGDDDGYVSFFGDVHQAHLPALTNWNGNSGLRKGYNLLMWIRPRLVENSDNAVENSKDIPTNVESNEGGVLYRFSTSTDDSTGTGICVVCSQWKAVPSDTKPAADCGTNGEGKTSSKPPQKNRQLETVLTAYTLPRFKPQQMRFSLSRSMAQTQYVQQPLILEENEWQLLGFSHSNPYLKSAVWSITLNGRLMGSDNLPYPVLPEHHHVNSMEYCSLFQGITTSGAILIDPAEVVGKHDYHKTASQLQAESAEAADSLSSISRFHRKVDLVMDLAAVSLYADKIVPLACLAVAADAGPALALQKGGRILPTLPPVPNWTKGASLEGPKVGGPLTVHSSALALQQLSSPPNLVFCCSAVSARILGDSGVRNTRLVCTMQIHAASTVDTPRVGLVQPAAPLRIEDDELPCLYVVGSVRLYHSLSQFLLHAPEKVAEQLSCGVEHTTKNLSVALLEMEMLSSFIRPFFLSLCPPGKIYDMHQGQYLESLAHLHGLYSNNAAYAAKLINLFTLGIRSGGGRAQEEVLQSGLLHVLASSLRLSLLRASRLLIFQDTVTQSVDDFVRKVQKLFPDETNVAPPQHGSSVSPTFIPSSIIDACCNLIDACCGPPVTFVENLLPHHQIRRTSDLALTAIFGLALDLDIWGGHPMAAASIIESVAQRYGGVCITSGYVLRSQVSVQHFLDMVRLRFDDSTYSQEVPAPLYIEKTALSLSMLLQVILLSSLSNTRSISQGENDVSACVSALTHCPLGTVGAHMILNALVGVLAWCDVLPVETASTIPEVTMSQVSQDGDKANIASRLGRNILVAQFHDVIAPMILSRTVLSGDQSVLPSSKHQPNQSSNQESNGQGHVCWQKHWRLSLLLFSWVASIAGPEGVRAAKSCGNLLLASSQAGSLEGALEKADKIFTSTLFLPSPTMSLILGGSLRNEWSYTDILSDRLEIMIPLLPGLIMSLLSQVSMVKEGNSSSASLSPANSITVLSETLTAVGGAFHRVFGGVIHLSSSSLTHAVKGSNAKKVAAVSGEIKAAKIHVPNLVLVALIIENEILLRKTKIFDGLRITTILKCRSSDDDHNSQTRLESWIDVTSSSSETLLNEIAVALPDSETISNTSLVNFLQSCQRNVINTTAGLISNTMDLGGPGAALPIWQSLLKASQEFSVYTRDPKKVEHTLQIVKDLRHDSNHIKDDNSQLDGSTESTESVLCNVSFHVVARNVLCNLISKVLFKVLKRTQNRDVWHYELSSAVAQVCLFVEETGLLGQDSNIEDDHQLSDEQIVLLCVLLELLSYGRESLGWCQIVIPSPPTVSDVSLKAMTGASTLLLPVLHSSLRLILLCLDRVVSTSVVSVHRDDECRQELLLDLIIGELNLTLTAAIVGQRFAEARETALHALASLRQVMMVHQAKGDNISEQICKSLFMKIAEELRVRYENERRIREKTFLDVYDAKDDICAKRAASEESQVIERLILGTELDNVVATEFDSADRVKESTNRHVGGVSEDFILFHEENGTLSNGSKLGFEVLQGLCSTLEAWKTASGKSSESNNSTDLLSLMSPFLDAWDRISVQNQNIPVFCNLRLGTTVVTSNIQTNQFVVDGSEAAADAMSTFFEFAATEKHRLKEISARFLPAYRYSRMAFADRFCWTRHSENMLKMEDLWERGIADGNRDIRSRVTTVPCFPQFRRFLPKYLDNITENKLTTEVAEELISRNSVAPAELGALTKSLLGTGLLEIKDITKKLIEEEDEQELLDPIPAQNIDEEEQMFAETDVRSDDNIHKELEKIEQSDEILKTSDIFQDTNTETLPVFEDEIAVFPTDLVGKGHHNITTSTFSTPPDNASSSLSLLHSAAKGLIEQHVENCIHVKAEGNRECTMLLTSSHLVLEYDGNLDGLYEGEILTIQEEADRQRISDEIGLSREKEHEDIFNQKLVRRQRELAALRSKSIRWNLTEVSHIYLRRYRLRDTALEIFFIPTGSTSFGGYGLFSPSSSLYLDFGPGYEGIARRDDAAFAIMRRAPSQALKQWPDRSEAFLQDQLNKLTVGWVEGRITNFDYLLHLNMLSGRSYNDICQYPVFPWVLSDYTSEEIPDLNDRSSFRDLSKPVGALNEDRLKEFLDRFHTFADPSIPPFMYGSHYSTSAGVVLHYLVRLHPMAGLHRQLQGGHFDVADRLFSSVPRTWSMCTGSSAAEVKELTPEWYCNPTFLRNVNKFKLGTSQDGEVIDDVVLPPWAKGSPETFIEIMRSALESDICSDMLSSWIDLIFGRKQQGPAAIEANNVFFYLTYYGTIDVASIEDESLRQATELQIAHFGQCPMQLFRRNHVRRLPKEYHYLSVFQVLSSFSLIRESNKVNYSTSNPATGQVLDRSRRHATFGEPQFLPFLSAPLSHWVHLDAPPPGPHAHLVAVRFADIDTCLAVDGKGVFHSFRWAWRPDEVFNEGSEKRAGNFDQGCFVAQRELPRFRSLPRLMYTPQDSEVVVAISKTLFAGRTVLLVLSDGDGCGSLGIQLVDPVKGEVRGEVLVPLVHSARITCLATDPIGTAAGHGGVGGELCLAGSADGSASLWRFMSSHYLPLRPRVKLRGHHGHPISAAALSSSLQIAVTLSTKRCCIHSIGNGALMRSFGPPVDTLEIQSISDIKLDTIFADCAALAVSVQGLIVTVCKTTILSRLVPDRVVITLHLFTVEGVSLGSKPLESWRGIPHKMYCTPDGTTLLVCCGRGVTLHRLSACQPLEFLDEFQITETDDYSNEMGLPAAWDIDFGPSLNRPVVAAAACSNGALRLHALPGISVWSERHKKTVLTHGIGNVISKPARRFNQAVLGGLGLGKQIAGIGRDLTKELSSDVKERGVGGFIGNIFRRGSMK